MANPHPIGRPPLPRARLTPEFLEAVNTCPVPNGQLSGAAGWKWRTNMLMVLRDSKGTAMSHRTRRRLLALARLVGYAGPLTVDGDLVAS